MTPFTYSVIKHVNPSSKRSPTDMPFPHLLVADRLRVHIRQDTQRTKNL